MTGEVGAAPDDVEAEDEGVDDYEAGDVNTTGPEGFDAVDDMVGNRAEEATSEQVLIYLARSLVAEPDAVVVERQHQRAGVRLRLHVAPEDMGRVIGRHGRTAQAIRTLVSAAGARQDVHTSVDIVDDD